MMGRRNTKRVLPGLLTLVTAAIELLSFLAGVSNLTQGKSEEDKQHLEEVVRRAAVACYASEGIYPPDLEYLKEHYGIQIDDTRYTVVYEVFALNLMPDITVLENET